MPDRKISELANASALGGSEAIAAVQGGVTVKTTPSQIAAYAREEAAMAAKIRSIVGTAVTKSASTALIEAELNRIVRVDASGGAVTLEMPSAPTAGDWMVVYKADNGANAVTIVESGGSPTIAVLPSEDDAQAMRFSGGVWERIGLTPALQAERIRDTMGAALTGGAGVTITPDDGGDTITVGAKSYVLAAGAGGSVTGTTAETALATVPIPGGAMGANGRLRITTLWKYTNSGNTKTLRIRLGGISGTGFMGINVTSTVLHQAQHIIRNHGAQNSQVAFNAAAANFDGSVANAETTGTVDTSTDKDLVFSVQLANGSDSAELLDYMVELIRP